MSVNWNPDLVSVIWDPHFECDECGDFGNDASGFATSRLCVVCADKRDIYFKGIWEGPTGGESGEINVQSSLGEEARD